MALLKKSFKFDVRELKASDDGKTASLAGYASVFGNVDSYNDIVEKGAFARTIQNNKKFTLLSQHNPDWPIGPIKKLVEDDHGLFMEADILLTVEKGRETYELLKADVIRGLSFAYGVVKKLVDENTGIRKLLELKLYEVSVVTFPANELATVTDLKSLKGEELTRALVAERCVGLAQELREALAEKNESDSYKLASKAVEEFTALRDALVPGPAKLNNDPELLHSLLSLTADAYKTLGGNQA